MKTTLKTQLVSLICLLIGIAITFGLLGLYGMKQTQAALKTVYEDRTVALEQVTRMERMVLQNEVSFIEALKSGDGAVAREKASKIAVNNTAIEKVWSEYLATYLTPEEKLIAEKLDGDRRRLMQDGLAPALKALEQGDLAGAAAQFATAEQISPAVTKGITALRDLQVNVAREEYETSAANFTRMNIIVLITLAAGIAVAALAGTFVVRGVYRQLGGEPTYARRIVQRIATGDLTATVELRDGDTSSLLAAMRDMQQQLIKTVGEIRASSETIAAASGEIASGNQDLSARTEQQAGSLEETASSMEELAVTVRQNADHSKQANEMVRGAAQAARDGNAVVNSVVDVMTNIRDSSGKITDIIGVIDSIAFQTNILALNAAVEAARAGEQGRGFAVVASEVRNLAYRSASAAKEVKQLIDDSNSKVGDGMRMATDAGNAMTAIVGRIDSVTHIMEEIASASSQQAAGIDQVNEAIVQMDAVTQNNASLVEEAAAASAQLNEHAAMLTSAVQVFRLEESAVVAAPHPTQLPVKARRPASTRLQLRAA